MAESFAGWGLYDRDGDVWDSFALESSIFLLTVIGLNIYCSYDFRLCNDAVLQFNVHYLNVLFEKSPDNVVNK